MRNVLRGCILLVIILIGEDLRAQVGLPPTPSTLHPNSASNLKDTNPTVFRPEVMPAFPGGQNALMQFISTHTKYPKDALDSAQMGTAYIRFMVDKKGKVTDITIKRSAGHSLLDQEALRVVNEMPKWKPGLVAGKPVNVYYILPVHFAFTNQ